MPLPDDVPPVLRPLLGELFSALARRLGEAENALNTADIEAFRHAAHAAKGMTMTFALHELAGEIARLETLVDRPDQARAALARLARLVRGLQRQGR